MSNLSIGVLISGGGSNLQAIIDASLARSISARILFVGSDNIEAGGLRRAENAGIPTFVTPYAGIIREFRETPEKVSLPDDFEYPDILKKQSLFRPSDDPGRVEFFLKSRAIAEADLLGKIRGYGADIIVLAGFMRTFTPYFIDRINGGAPIPRIINIHPALLPSFPGVDGYGDTFRHGCRIGGCTVHFIDYGEDTGPIIGQKAFEILPEDTLESVKKKGLELEWQLYPECIQLIAENRVSLERRDGKQVVVIRNR
jgi:phosphoribosylglycinamide formyltransferase-1